MATNNQQAWWLEAIGRIPLLTPAEELELGQAVQRWLRHPEPCPPGVKRRGMRARDRFVQANLRLVVSYVSKRCSRFARIHGSEDLIQAGNLGLITAVERFDPARGYKFSTYAYWWIRQSIGRHCDTLGRCIAIPGSHSQYLGRIGPITRRLEGELGRMPTHQEIAKALGCSETVLAQVMENGRAISSLDQVVGDGDLELGSLCPSFDRIPEEHEEQAKRWKQAEQLRKLIDKLPVQDRRLLSLAWGLDGEVVPRHVLATQEGLSTRALGAKLKRLQAQLATQDGLSIQVLEAKLGRLQTKIATQSFQLVLVAVGSVAASPKPKRKRCKRPDAVEQLLLSLSVS